MKRLCAILVSLCVGFYAFGVRKSSTIVYIDGAKYYIHTVLPGETLYGLSKTYGVGEQAIRAHNPGLADGLKADARVKIPFVAESASVLPERKLKKTFDMHYVVRGETLYGISRRYAIAIPTLMEDNPNLDPAQLKPGQRILVRKKQIGKEPEHEARAAWEEYRNTLNSVAEQGTAYYIVQPGDTFYALSHRYEISEAELSALNDGLQAADLKAGALLKVPSVGTAESEADDACDTLRQVPAEPRDTVREIVFRALPPNETLRVALLLPVEAKEGANANYLEFYQGFLLGIDSVRNRYGHSVDVTLFNTRHDLQTVEEIVATPEFRRSNLIVGPVYEELLPPVLAYAEEHEIPVVSPLARLTQTNSDAVFQLSPDAGRKYEKEAELVGTDRRVTLIYTENTDREFEREVLDLLGDTPYARHTYKFQHPSVRSAEGGPGDLTPLLKGEEEKLFVVMADNEIDVDRILVSLASAHAGLTGRGLPVSRFTVLGNTRWNRYNNIDRTMFFKNRVVFTSTYHAKRDSEAVRRFDNAYIRAFGTLPTLYSYRGYDTAAIFGPGMFADIEYDMEGRRYQPLQTAYLFELEQTPRRLHVNRNWTRVNYNSDFTVTLE